MTTATMRTMKRTKAKAKRKMPRATKRSIHAASVRQMVQEDITELRAVSKKLRNKLN